MAFAVYMMSTPGQGKYSFSYHQEVIRRERQSVKPGTSAYRFRVATTSKKKAGDVPALLQFDVGLPGQADDFTESAADW